MHSNCDQTDMTALINNIDFVESGMDYIPANRKKELEQLASLIKESVLLFGNAHLNFVCTHNSRRSQLAQIMFSLAFRHYHLGNLNSWSSGTEATAFNHRMVKALQEFGITITKQDDSDNPRYAIIWDRDSEDIQLTFSKVIDDPFNPSKDFIAVMVCDHADQNCPFVPGAWKRFSLPYKDPKAFDNTPEESNAYNEKVLEIGREMFYIAKALSQQ